MSEPKLSRKSPQKREAILEAALDVFAREGYARATIEVIAAEAGVSTRTIYNHFEDKEKLFETTIHESATRVAEAHIAIIARHLENVSDLDADLAAMGLAWRMSLAEYPRHEALVRQLRAEANHIPRAAIEAWRELGPLRVRRELARYFRRLTDQGLLRTDDPERAALHFTVLISASDRTSPAADEVAEAVAAGIRAFLYGYAR